jgi:hypothetical protein
MVRRRDLQECPCLTLKRTISPPLHNAMWTGLVGKGPDSEPPIDLETMLRLTAAATVDGVRFEGVDLFLSLPHTDIDSCDEDLARLAGNLQSKGLVAGSLVAPVWPATGGGSAMGSEEDRVCFLRQVRKACRIGRKLRNLGIRQYGVIRVDSAASPSEWLKDPAGNTKRIAQTFREACNIAEAFGERLAAEGDFDWSGPGLAEAYRKMASALRPWTIDFHVAQNDGTVKGSGSHDKTGRHCQPTDPNGKLDIVRDAGAWLRDDKGEPLRKLQHICWDGCMFPNAVMLDPKTWNDVLTVMVAVRDAHGWN